MFTHPFYNDIYFQCYYFLVLRLFSFVPLSLFWRLCTHMRGGDHTYQTVLTVSRPFYVSKPAILGHLYFFYIFGILKRPQNLHFLFIKMPNGLNK